MIDQHPFLSQGSEGPEPCRGQPHCNNAWGPARCQLRHTMDTVWTCERVGNRRVSSGATPCAHVVASRIKTQPADTRMNQILTSEEMSRLYAGVGGLRAPMQWGLAVLVPLYLISRAAWSGNALPP